MRSLIILKGLVKSKKLSWVKRENLVNFFIDIEDIRKVFYKPEYKGSRDFLTRSHDELVYKVFMEALISRLSTGCLVVVDVGQDSTISIEELALFFGYTVFYHVEKTPTDFIGKNRKYCENCYLIPSKETLKKEVKEFNSISYKDKIVISSYREIESYFKKVSLKLGKKDTVLHVSDLHSHYNIYDQIISKVPSDITVFLGDYIDGPEEGGSRKLIDFIINNEDTKLIFLEGNHEVRLRKYLAYIYFKGKNKKTIYDILESCIPDDFERTRKEFDNLTPTESLNMIKKLNSKLSSFFIYEKANLIYICTHSGIRWIEQLSPKYIGNVICSNKNPDRIDEHFSNNYFKQNLISIHGHCKYPDKLSYFKYPGVINIDTEDENNVNYFINDTVNVITQKPY